MSKAKVLVVEDDRTLLDVLKYNLAKESYDVVTAVDGNQALEVALREKPDLIILDILLPGLDGFEVCRILRKDLTVPVLMLTAKDDEADKVIGLHLGADDYMTKPFSMKELLARIQALLRRARLAERKSASHEKDEFVASKSGRLQIDVARRKVLLDGMPISLRPKEFDILTLLVKNQGRVFTRDQLLEKVWGYDYGGNTRTIDVHIGCIRQKIEVDPTHPRLVLTVHGVGYKFDEESND